jgi:hypothetical protein
MVGRGSWVVGNDRHDRQSVGERSQLSEIDASVPFQYFIIHPTLM